MTPAPCTPWNALDLLRAIATRLLLEKNIDLSARQMAVLLTAYLAPGPHTVKSLSAELHISKAAICRAVDALCRRGFAERRKDTRDGRLTQVQRTLAGAAFLGELSDIVLAHTHLPATLKIPA